MVMAQGEEKEKDGTVPLGFGIFLIGRGNEFF